MEFIRYAYLSPIVEVRGVLGDGPWLSLAEGWPVRSHQGDGALSQHWRWRYSRPPSVTPTLRGLNCFAQQRSAPRPHRLSSNHLDLALRRFRRCRRRRCWPCDVASPHGFVSHRALAWCQEGGDSTPPPPPSTPDTNRPRDHPLARDSLAVGTSTGAVFLFKVDIGSSGGGSGSGGQANERSNSAEALAMPAAVRAVPFRRVCVPDGSPVTFLAHVVLGERGGGALSSGSVSSAVVVVVVVVVVGWW